MGNKKDITNEEVDNIEMTEEEERLCNDYLLDPLKMSTENKARVAGIMKRFKSTPDAG